MGKYRRDCGGAWLVVRFLWPYLKKMLTLNLRRKVKIGIDEGHICGGGTRSDAQRDRRQSPTCGLRRGIGFDGASAVRVVRGAPETQQLAVERRGTAHCGSARWVGKRDIFHTVTRAVRSESCR